MSTYSTLRAGLVQLTREPDSAPYRWRVCADRATETQFQTVVFDGGARADWWFETEQDAMRAIRALAKQGIITGDDAIACDSDKFKRIVFSGHTGSRPRIKRRKQC